MLGFEADSWAVQRAEQLTNRERLGGRDVAAGAVGGGGDRAEELFGWQQQLHSIRWLRCISPAGLTATPVFPGEVPAAAVAAVTDAASASPDFAAAADVDLAKLGSAGAAPAEAGELRSGGSDWVRIVEPGEIVEVLEYCPLHAPASGGGRGGAAQTATTTAAAATHTAQRVGRLRLAVRDTILPDRPPNRLMHWWRRAALGCECQ